MARARRTPSPADLAVSDEVHWYLNRGWEDGGGSRHKIGWPTCLPAIVTPEPTRLRTARFDAARVDKVLDVFSRLRHTKGQWAGRPLIPDPWQIAYIIAPTFGWVQLDPTLDDYVRIVRTLYVDVSRKNGKSTLLGGIGLYLACADGEQGAEVLVAATTRGQAGFVFNPVKKIAASSPDVSPYVQPLATRINHKPTGSYLEVIASAASAQHGGNIHGGVVDELHLHKSRDLVEAIETGTGSRTQPLVAMITTADAGKQDTVYAEKRAYCEKVAKRVFIDHTFRGVVFAAPRHLDPLSKEAQQAANPGYGISPTARYLTSAANKARNSAAELSSYKRLHLGWRTKQQTAYFELDVWDRNASLVDEDALKGRTCYGGMDLATTSDLCAVCWLFPDGEGGLDALWRHWIPERAFDKMVERTARTAEVWRDDGSLTVTPGDVADYDYIRAKINDDRRTFKAKTIAYDRWNASQLVVDLGKDGAELVQMGQGYASMSGPLKQIKHMLLAGTAETPLFRHGGNRLMRWQVDNLAVDMDPAGNVKPNKKSSGDKIDGFSAAVDAMAEVMAARAHLPAPPAALPQQAASPPRQAEVFTQQF